MLDEERKEFHIDKGKRVLLANDEPMGMDRFAFELKLFFRPRNKEMYAIKGINVQVFNPEKIFSFQDIAFFKGVKDSNLIYSFDNPINHEYIKQRKRISYLK